MAPSCLIRGLKRSWLNLLPWILTLVLNPGCVSTKLTPRPIEPPFASLARANRNPINIVIESPGTELSLGHQFLFPIFPVGTISAPEAENFLSQSAFRELSLAGFTPLTDSVRHDAQPTLSIALKSASLSGYDLFVTRKIKCSVAVTGLYSKDRGIPRQFTSEANVSEYETYAFKPELERLFDRCLRESMVRLLDGLGMTRGS